MTELCPFNDFALRLVQFDEMKIIFLVPNSCFTSFPILLNYFTLKAISSDDNTNTVSVPNHLPMQNGSEVGKMTKSKKGYTQSFFLWILTKG